MRPIDVRYFLRVWQDGRRSEGLRASIRDLATGRTHNFGDLDQLRRHFDLLDGDDTEEEPTDEDPNP